MQKCGVLTCTLYFQWLSMDIGYISKKVTPSIQYLLLYIVHNLIRLRYFWFKFFLKSSGRKFGVAAPSLVSLIWGSTSCIPWLPWFLRQPSSSAVFKSSPLLCLHLSHSQYTLWTRLSYWKWHPSQPAASMFMPGQYHGVALPLWMLNMNDYHHWWS